MRFYEVQLVHDILSFLCIAPLMLLLSNRKTNNTVAFRIFICKILSPHNGVLIIYSQTCTNCILLSIIIRLYNIGTFLFRIDVCIIFELECRIVHRNNFLYFIRL